jgi:bifunctional oligoribonuclease and PAP phosphatase NrnA
MRDAPSIQRDLLRDLTACSRVLLTGPVAPDGDSIGACLALQRILVSRGVQVDVAGTASYRYDWLPGAPHMVPDDQILPIYDGVVVLDGDRHRLTAPVQEAFAAAPLQAIIDHHASTQDNGYTHCWLDPGAASTCEMLYGALDLWAMPLDQDLAELLYTGSVFDTGGFRYSNTTHATHTMAAALVDTGVEHAAICTKILMERRVSGLRLSGHVFSNATFHLNGELAIGYATLDLRDRFQNIDGDLEGIVDQLVHTCGVEVAILLVERSPRNVKFSLRSRGLINVSQVARAIAPSGGGHPKAAGVSIVGTVQDATDVAVNTVGTFLSRADRRGMSRLQISRRG